MYPVLSMRLKKMLTYKEAAQLIRLTVPQVKCLVICGKLRRRGSPESPILLEDLNEFLVRLNTGNLRYGIGWGASVTANG